MRESRGKLPISFHNAVPPALEKFLPNFGNRLSVRLHCYYYQCLPLMCAFYWYFSGKLWQATLGERSLMLPLAGIQFQIYFSGVQWYNSKNSKFDLMLPKRYYIFTTHTQKCKCKHTALAIWAFSHFWMCVYTYKLFEGCINLVYWNIICGFCFSTSCWGNLPNMIWHEIFAWERTVTEIEIINALVGHCANGKQEKIVKPSLLPTLHGQLIFLTLQSPYPY